NANTNLQNLLNNMGSKLDKLDNLADALKALHSYFIYPMQVNEFLFIPNKDIVYKVSNDN
ncbi:14916_t:CDS:1, partial [Cetraspora pellucida]